jgi:hypothetical protein
METVSIYFSNINFVLDNTIKKSVTVYWHSFIKIYIPNFLIKGKTKNITSSEQFQNLRGKCGYKGKIDTPNTHV